MCSLICNVPIRGHLPAAAISQSEGQSDRENRASTMARRTSFFVVCFLAAVLSQVALWANDPLSALENPKQAADHSSPSPSEESAIESTPPETPPAFPQSAPVTREDLPGALRKDMPSSMSDLKTIEAHVKDLANRVAPAVVAVRINGATGSGVVISEDGLVLTAAHVGGEPNRDVHFTFPDGRTARGKTLGMNHEMDAGLMKITDKGHWPHLDIGDLAQARLGDWVLALGHPGGFDPQRPTVLRLGRIIRLGTGWLQTDCALIGGDSGGPLIDMQGRVIGIHSRISDSVAENFHVPIAAYHDSWDRLVKGENWGGRRGPRSYVGIRGVDHPEGFQLERIDEESPASRVDLKVGDIVTKVNGQKIKDYDAFRQSVARSKPGEDLTLDIKRDDQELSVKLTVGTRRWRGRGQFGP